MNVVRFSEPGFAARMRQLAGASSLFDKTIEERARSIVDAVHLRGDAALLEFTERWSRQTLWEKLDFYSGIFWLDAIYYSHLDAEGRSFTNINTPDDLRAAQTKLET